MSVAESFFFGGCLPRIGSLFILTVDLPAIILPFSRNGRFPGRGSLERREDFFLGIRTSLHTLHSPASRSFLAWQQHSRSVQWIRDTEAGSSALFSSRIGCEIKLAVDKNPATLFLVFFTGCRRFQIWLLAKFC